jgi:hypothetical protein
MTNGTVPVVVMGVGLVESVAITLMFVVPGVVGIPVMVQPFDPPAVNPAGRFVITQVYGPVPPETPTVPL